MRALFEDEIMHVPGPTAVLMGVTDMEIPYRAAAVPTDSPPVLP